VLGETSAGVGAAKQAIQIRNIRAWFVRPFVRLYYSNNSKGALVWVWGTVGYQLGFKDSSAPQDQCEVYAVKPGGWSLTGPWGVSIPIPGFSIPTIIVGGASLNWQGYNDTSSPTLYGTYIESNFPGTAVGPANVDPSLPIPKIPSPPSGYK
jgi:hypothetical protein